MAVKHPVALPATVLESSGGAPEATCERTVNWWGGPREPARIARHIGGHEDAESHSSFGSGFSVCPCGVRRNPLVFAARGGRRGNQLRGRRDAYQLPMCRRGRGR